MRRIQLELRACGNTERLFWQPYILILLSVLISSGSAGSALSFGWMKMLLRDECLMQWSEIMGLSHTRWKDQVEEALTSLGVTNWTRHAQSRGAWRETLRLWPHKQVSKFLDFMLISFICMGSEFPFKAWTDSSEDDIRLIRFHFLATLLILLRRIMSTINYK